MNIISYLWVIPICDMSSSPPSKRDLGYSEQGARLSAPLNILQPHRIKKVISSLIFHFTFQSLPGFLKISGSASGSVQNDLVHKLFAKASRLFVNRSSREETSCRNLIVSSSATRRLLFSFLHFSFKTPTDSLAALFRFSFFWSAGISGSKRWPVSTIFGCKSILESTRARLPPVALSSFDSVSATRFWADRMICMASRWSCAQADMAHSTGRLAK